MSYPINISRPNNLRWLFSIRIKGQRNNKSFYDSNYGSKKAAYEAALKYKEKIYTQHDLNKKGRGTSGPIIGVSRTFSKREKRPGKITEHAYWQAVWVGANGRQQTKRFSISRHGEDNAKKLAIQARRSALQALKKGSDPRFIQPSARYAKLWRYMSFTKLLSFLEDSAIFFSPAADFEDPYEGTLPEGNKFLEGFVKSKSNSKKNNIIVADKTKVMITCWHMSKYESAAMWKLYGQGNETICITTKYGKLKNQLNSSAQIGLVQYVDFKTAWAPEENLYYPFMFKRKSFEHEKEVRALIDFDTIDKNNSQSSEGYKNKVNLNLLIDEIFIAPDASDWFFELVKKIVGNYNIKAKVIRSKLLELPL